MANSKNLYIDFTRSAASPLFAKTTNAIATGADNQEDYFYVNGNKYLELVQDGANAEIDGGPMFTPAATGWTIPMDNAADAVEITPGIVSGLCPSFTSATDPAFFMRVVLFTGTIARNTVLLAGFRKLGAYVDFKGADATAALTAYDDKAVIGVVDVASTFATQTSKATVDVQTALAHAAVTNDDWVALEVDVSAAGAVTYKIGTSTSSAAAAKAALAADANAVAFTMTAAEYIPTIMCVGTAATGIWDAKLISFECGYQDTN